MLQDSVAQAVGNIPSGLFIVAVKGDESIDGYLASFVQQISFNPLIIALAIKPGRPAYDLIKAGKKFAVNVAGDHDKTYLKHFWKGYDPNHNPFNEIPYEMGVNGGVLLTQAKSAMECQMIGSARPGDHELIFAEVKSSYIFNAESKPLIHLRKSGADY